MQRSIIILVLIYPYKGLLRDVLTRVHSDAPLCWAWLAEGERGIAAFLLEALSELAAAHELGSREFFVLEDI